MLHKCNNIQGFCVQDTSIPTPTTEHMMTVPATAIEPFIYYRFGKSCYEIEKIISEDNEKDRIIEEKDKIIKRLEIEKEAIHEKYEGKFKDEVEREILQRLNSISTSTGIKEKKHEFVYNYMHFLDSYSGSQIEGFLLNLIRLANKKISSSKYLLNTQRDVSFVYLVLEKDGRFKGRFFSDLTMSVFVNYWNDNVVKYIEDSARQKKLTLKYDTFKGYFEKKSCEEKKYKLVYTKEPMTWAQSYREENVIGKSILEIACNVYRMMKDLIILPSLSSNGQK